jgi:hypothetical protein
MATRGPLRRLRVLSCCGHNGPILASREKLYVFGLRHCSHWFGLDVRAILWSLAAWLTIKAGKDETCKFVPLAVHPGQKNSQSTDRLWLGQAFYLKSATQVCLPISAQSRRARPRLALAASHHRSVACAEFVRPSWARDRCDAWQLLLLRRPFEPSPVAGTPPFRVAAHSRAHRTLSQRAHVHAPCWGASTLCFGAAGWGTNAMLLWPLRDVVAVTDIIAFETHCFAWKAIPVRRHGRRWHVRY